VSDIHESVFVFSIDRYGGETFLIQGNWWAKRSFTQNMDTQEKVYTDPQIEFLANPKDDF